MLFFKSCLVGCMVAIPVGPVGLLLIQRSLSIGPLAGIFTGLGAALADGLFGFLAAVGLVTLLGELEAGRHFLRPLGSLALMIVGAHFFFQKPPKLAAHEILTGRFQRRFWWDTISACFLTLMNPTTIIAFTVLFAGSDLIPENPGRESYFEIAGGIFTGSLVWWLFLVGIAEPVKRRLNPHSVHRFLQVLGVVLVVLALFTFLPRLGTVIENVRRLL
ncbi:MAG TPA: LysE family transporter [bacterium]|nr:LysE family transporter [bacterium]